MAGLEQHRARAAHAKQWERARDTELGAGRGASPASEIRPFSPRALIPSQLRQSGGTGPPRLG